MKNLFKIGFLALAICLSLTSCDWFTSSPKPKPVDANKIDSAQIDSPKTDSQTIDSNKLNPDSVNFKQ